MSQNADFADIADARSGKGVSEKMLTLLTILGSVDVGQEHNPIKNKLVKYFLDNLRIPLERDVKSQKVFLMLMEYMFENEKKYSSIMSV